MKRIPRILISLLISVLVAGVAASIFSTQFVIAGLQGIDVNIPLKVRLGMTASDLSIIQTLAMVFTACFIVAFSVAVFAAKKLGGKRVVWLSIGGGAGVIATLLLLEAALQLTPIAGARSIFGLSMQGIAGAIGGYTFAKLTQQKVSQ